MFNRHAASITIFALVAAAVLAGCGKKEPTVSVPEKGILAEKTEFDFPELEENHKKNMERNKAVFDKYPVATSHSIVLDDGTKVEIPQQFQGLDLYKSKWAYETFTKEQFAKIDAACAREGKRFYVVAGIIDLPEPLRILCQQSALVKNGSKKALR